MKNKIKNITLAALCIIAAACQDNSVLYDLPTPADTMELSVSSDNITLDQDNPNATAVTFTWKDAADRGAGTTLTYYFKIDVAGNSFATSIAKRQIADGVRSVSLTNKELNEFLYGWNITPGENAMLEAEIIAEVSGGEVYMKPEISKVEFMATGFVIPSKSLYVVGDATEAGWDPAKALRMTELIPGMEYTWTGRLTPDGGFKFIEDTENLTPSYNKSAEGNALVYRISDDQPDNMFQVQKEGIYTIKINVITLTITSELYLPPYDQIWMVGDAAPNGWEIMKSTLLERDPVNRELFYYEGPLKTGEIKFPLQLKDDWSVPFLMPVVNQTGTIGDNRMEYVAVGGHDFKWKISEAGNYKVTLNINLMTILFEKK